MFSGEKSSASSASSASSSSNSTADAISQKTKQTLVDIFAFPSDAADKAIEAIGDKSDVEMAISWILDHNLCEDKGGPIQTVRCPHLDMDGCAHLGDPLTLSYEPRKCSEKSCIDSGEVWICLHCSEKRCSRYVKKHSLEHFEKTKSIEESKTSVADLASGKSRCFGHFIALSLSDLSIWCYICNKYIFHESLRPYTIQMQNLKFSAKETQFSSIIPGKSSDNSKSSSAEKPKEKNMGWKRDESGKWIFDEVEHIIQNQPPPLTDKQAHGFKGASNNWDQPTLVNFCESQARPGYASMSAHEYFDTPRTLTLKAKLFVQMLKESKNAIVYSGAGLSTAAGISDYATQVGDKSAGSTTSTTKKRVSPWKARPTLSHRVLVSLFEAGYIKHWVNQNHDGLPEKAGFPVNHINNIHGAWYDPTNPVVPMTGTLRSDLIEWLVDWEEKADFVLALGSSLCGMNADRLVTTCSKKAKSGKGIGSVIISLQRTQHDELSSLRVFSTLDHFFDLVVKELQLSVREDDPVKYELTPPLDQEIFKDIPYDPKTGLLSTTKKMTLDLRKGSKLKFVNQPEWDMKRAGNTCESLGRSDDGHFLISIAGGKTNRVLGIWYIRAAMEGKLKQIPVIPC